MKASTRSSLVQGCGGRFHPGLILPHPDAEIRGHGQAVSTGTRPFYYDPMPTLVAQDTAALDLGGGIRGHPARDQPRIRSLAAPACTSRWLSIPTRSTA